MPPHNPQSSNSNVEPQVLSHPDGPGSPHPQPKSIFPSQSQVPSSIPLPPHSPHSSITALPSQTPKQSSIAVPLHSPKQSATAPPPHTPSQSSVVPSSHSDKESRIYVPNGNQAWSFDANAS